jgi:hypothetical protein
MRLFDTGQASAECLCPVTIFRKIANMPKLYRTPEDIFRAEGKDVNFLHFNEVDETQLAQTRREMEDWLAQHLPGTRTEPMRSTESMGFLTGGPVGLRVDFSPQGLLTFCKRWENTATGQSLDPRFQCYLMRYADWFAEHGHFVPSLDKPGHACIATSAGRAVSGASCAPPGFVDACGQAVASIEGARRRHLGAWACAGQRA